MKLTIAEGRCYVFHAFDLGLSIDLAKCDQVLREPRESARFRHHQKAPKYFDYDPPPLRISQTANQFTFTHHEFCSRDNVDVTIFDFGAVSVAYKLELKGPLDRLVDLSDALYENEELFNDAKKRVELLFREIAPAVTKPDLNPLCESYIVFNVFKFEESVQPEEIMSQFPQTLSQILRSEKEECSKNELEDALSCSVSYAPGDLAIIDWNTAILYGRDMGDVRAVLEFANVELLEMRYQDGELDQALESAYVALTSGSRPGADLDRVARLQVDSAMMFEGVNNALKLLGDQYLARLYSLVSKRFHLTDWDASILRKLEMLNSIYTKIADQAARRRSEMMELIIIALITFEVVMSLL